MMAIVGGGGQAELAVVHERQAMPVPDALDWPARAASPRSSRPPTTRSSPRRGCTTGERLLVHGAAGGVGTAAVQLGKVTGAHVTGTVRNEEKRTAVKELGADEVDRARRVRGRRPVRRDPRARRRAQPAGQPEGARDGRPHRRDRHRRRRQGRAQPRAADGQAGADHGLDAPRPPARGEGAHRPRASSATSCRTSKPATSRSRSRRRSPSTTWPTPTTLHGRRQARQDRADIRLMESSTATAGKREERKAQNRAKLLTAARKVFAEKGLGAATARDIVRETDLATGTFYNYFDSKEEVFTALLEELSRPGARGGARRAPRGRPRSRSASRTATARTSSWSSRSARCSRSSAATPARSR